MSDQLLPVRLVERAHCQLMFVTLPSGSVSVAVTAAPTTGLLRDRLTLPGSSTLVTVTFTVALSLPPFPSLTVAVKERVAAVS